MFYKVLTGSFSDYFAEQRRTTSIPTLNVFYYKNYRTAQWILKINTTNGEIFLPT